MAFKRPIHPEWVEFPDTPLMGAHRRSPRFWHTRPKALTGNTGQTFVEAVETPSAEYMHQSSLMQTPYLGNLAPSKNRAMLMSSPSHALNTRGFAARVKGQRSAQLQLIPNTSLPFYGQTSVPKYISEVPGFADTEDLCPAVISSPSKPSMLIPRKLLTSQEVLARDVLAQDVADKKVTQASIGTPVVAVGSGILIILAMLIGGKKKR